MQFVVYEQHTEKVYAHPSSLRRWVRPYIKLYFMNGGYGRNLLEEL